MLSVSSSMITLADLLVQSSVLVYSFSSNAQKTGCCPAVKDLLRLFAESGEKTMVIKQSLSIGLFTCFLLKELFLLCNRTGTADEYSIFLLLKFYFKYIDLLCIYIDNKNKFKTFTEKMMYSNNCI